MSDLALAVFASETGTHLVRPPTGGRWAAHLRAFDGRAYEERLAAKHVRFIPRSAPAFPPLLRAILGHATYSGVPRDTAMAKALFAVDELCGFLVACALVRPSKSFADLEVSSVKKKLKDKAFARGVNRDEVRQGAEELGVPLDEHIAFCIQALRPVESGLGLGG